MNTKNKKLFYIILTIIVLFVVVGIFILYQTTQKETIIEGEWKTYVDEDNGYSIQYPSGMVVRFLEQGYVSGFSFVLGSSRDEEELETVEVEEEFTVTRFWKERLNVGYSHDAYHIGQTIETGTINGLEDYRLFLVESELYAFSSTTIAGYNAIKATIPYLSLRTEFVFIQGPSGNISYIEYIYGSERYKNIVERMISTFRFIDTEIDECSGIEFKDYPINEVYDDEIANVNFDSFPPAANFSGRVKQGIEGGPNFAGHYTIVTWGCGTNCQSSVIVDAKTGEITPYYIPSEYGLTYRLDGNLLIVDHGFAPTYSLGDNLEYYEFKNGELNFLCKNY